VAAFNAGGESGAAFIELVVRRANASYFRAALHHRGREQKFESLSCCLTTLISRLKLYSPLIPVSSNVHENTVLFCTKSILWMLPQIFAATRSRISNSR